MKIFLLLRLLAEDGVWTSLLFPCQLSTQSFGSSIWCPVYSISTNDHVRPYLSGVANAAGVLLYVPGLNWAMNTPSSWSSIRWPQTSLRCELGFLFCCERVLLSAWTEATLGSHMFDKIPMTFPTFCSLPCPYLYQPCNRQLPSPWSRTWYSANCAWTCTY